MKTKKKKLIIWLSVAAVLIIVLANLFSGGEAKTKVQAEPVSRQDLVEEVSASGWIQPKTRVNITAEVNAKVIGIAVKEGDRVNRGQLLIQLDTVQLQKDVEQFRHSLEEINARKEAAHANYLQAEEEYERQKQLYERKLTSETAYKNAEYAYLNNKYNYEAMSSQAKQGNALFEKAVDNLRKTEIRAPMDGVVTFLDVEVGEIAQAQTAFTQGKTLMIISNLDAFEAEVDVDETEITKIQNKQLAHIEIDAFPDSVFEGEVTEIGNTAVKSNMGADQSTNFKVKVLFKGSQENIRPGMSASVDILTNKREKVLSVPYGAIVMRPPDILDSAKVEAKSEPVVGTEAVYAASDTHLTTTDSKKDEKAKDIKGVFVLRDGKAVFIPVITGIADQKSIEIISGLNENDTVISGPFKVLRSIKNGDLVEPEKKAAPGEIK